MKGRQKSRFPKSEAHIFGRLAYSQERIEKKVKDINSILVTPSGNTGNINNNKREIYAPENAI